MSSTELSVTKSILAKLLAGENISIVHKKVSTAAFDLKTRTLYLPIWEDMTGELYDLLNGHEVGHALYTPTDGWHTETHDAGGKFLGKFKDVLNVCEDARIEKLIKRKYPGLSKSFVAGYKILYARDFFGIKGLNDLSKLNIIDRINLYAKCGAFIVVPFTDEERELVRAVENAETWEQVVEISKSVFEKAKADRDSKMNNLDDLTEELLKQFEDQLENMDPDDMEFDIQSESSDEKDDSEEDSLKKATDSESSEEESDEKGGEDASNGEENDTDDDDKDGDSDTGSDGGKDADKDPESITDRKFRERERELISEATEVYTYNLPKPILDRIVIPHKAFMDTFYEKLAETQKLYNNNVDPVVATCAKRFAEKNNRYINLLVKEFEMRKNARQYARTTVAKTGELDMSKLHQYRFSNDLFKKVSVVEKGKSHGMIMYVDMSGSMNEVFGNTMEQTLILVAFCRKVGIPFEVYGFCDQRANLNTMIQKKRISSNFVGSKFQQTHTDTYEIEDKGFHLIHFISSNMTGSYYRRAFDLMAVVAMNWKNRIYPRLCLSWDQMGFYMGGTPFTQTLMASRPMIERFKAENKLDICNTIYLTDGEGTSCFKFTDIKRSPINYETGKPKITQHIFLIDQKTKRRVEFNAHADHSTAQQKAMTIFVRNLTGCKHIGFYVADRLSIRNKICELKASASEAVQKEFERQWREDKAVVAPNIGYDMYYYVQASKQGVNDPDYEIDEDMSNKKIAKVFSDAQDGKRQNRILVSKFAQDIAA